MLNSLTKRALVIDMEGDSLESFVLALNAQPKTVTFFVFLVDKK